MWKKRICVVILLLVLLLCPAIIYANNYAQFYTNSDTDLDAYFKLDKYDIEDILEWIRNKKTFITVEVRSGWDGSMTAWVNCPNLQQYMWNKLQCLVSSGYETEVTDLDESTKDTIFPTHKDGHTAMYKWGFNIPSNKYLGEWPTISFDASSLYPTSSWWGSFKAVVRGVFGGNVLNDITKDNLGTFYYDNMHDYVDGIYGYQVWIRDHWDEAMDYAIHEKSIGPEYPMLTKSFCGNNKGEFNGKTYNIQTCIIDLGLKKMEGTPEEFEKKLRTLWGSEFYEIFFCCVTLTPTDDRNGSDSYADTTKYPLRIMPYETDTLNVPEGLVQDPRSEHARGNLDFFVKFNLTTLFKNDFYVRAVGFICKLCWLFDSWCRLSWITTFVPIDAVSGVAIFIDALLGIVAIMFVIRTLIHAKDVLVGKKGIGMGLAYVFGTFVICSFIVAAVNKNDRIIEMYENILNFCDDVGVAMFFDEGDNPTTELVNGATDTELHEMIFWLPYYNEWCVYNTSHTYDDPAQDGSSGGPELDEAPGDLFPYINGKKIEKWCAALINAFTNSNKGVISNNAYRVIDHFEAPRLSIDDPHAAKISSTRNENFTYPVQTSSTHCLILCILLLISTIFKLLVFICLFYNFVFLYAYIVQALVVAKSNKTVKDVTKEFIPLAKNFGLYFIAGFIQSMISYYTTQLPVNNVTSSIIYFIIFSIFIVIEWWLFFNPMRPKLIDGLRELSSYI